MTQDEHAQSGSGSVKRICPAPPAALTRRMRFSGRRLPDCLRLSIPLLTLMNLLTIHDDVTWGIDAEAYFVAFHAQYRDRHLITDADGLLGTAG